MENVKKETKNKIDKVRGLIKYLGILMIDIAILIPLNIPRFVYPVLDEMGMDTTQYALETNVNLVRYMGLAAFLLVLGIASMVYSNRRQKKWFLNRNLCSYARPTSIGIA